MKRLAKEKAENERLAIELAKEKAEMKDYKEKAEMKD